PGCDTSPVTPGEAGPEFVSPAPGAGMPPSKVMINPQAAFPAGGDRYDGTGHANSGLLDKGKGWSLTFTRPGAFEYVCSVHPLMKAAIRVQPEGSPYPMTPDQGQAQARQQIQSDLQRGPSL